MPVWLTCVPHSSFPQQAISPSWLGPVSLWSLISCSSSLLPVHPKFTSVPPEVLNQHYAFCCLPAFAYAVPSAQNTAAALLHLTNASYFRSQSNIKHSFFHSLDTYLLTF